MPANPAPHRPRALGWLLLLLLLTWGCASSAPSGREWVKPAYREKIMEWQMRIRSEGWSEGRVRSMLRDFRRLAAYRPDIVDHWDTPKEFAADGFSGDCEDIAVFMMGTLKRLGYPYGLRVLVVEGLFEDHALLKVEVPEGGWKVYDVVPASVPAPDPALLRPIVEFDDARVSWFPVRAERASAAGRAHGLSAGDSESQGHGGPGR